MPRAPRDGRTNCPPNTAVLVGILSWLYNLLTDFARALLTTVKVTNSVAGSLACNFAVAFVNPPTGPQRPVYTYRWLVLSVWSPRLLHCAEAQAVVNVVAPASAHTSRLDCVAVVGQASRALSPGLQPACYAHATSAWRLKLDGARVRQPDFPKHHLNYMKRGKLSITRNKYAV